jgi:hypothetical protein
MPRSPVRSARSCAGRRTLRGRRSSRRRRARYGGRGPSEATSRCVAGRNRGPDRGVRRSLVSAAILETSIRGRVRSNGLRRAVRVRRRVATLVAGQTLARRTSFALRWSRRSELLLGVDGRRDPALNETDGTRAMVAGWSEQRGSGFPWCVAAPARRETPRSRGRSATGAPGAQGGLRRGHQGRSAPSSRRGRDSARHVATPDRRRHGASWGMIAGRVSRSPEPLPHGQPRRAWPSSAASPGWPSRTPKSRSDPRAIATRADRAGRAGGRGPQALRTRPPCTARSSWLVSLGLDGRLAEESAAARARGRPLGASRRC